jgi:transcriptional regulator
MLIRPRDAAQNEDEWKSFLSAHDFGQLIASGNNRPIPVIVPAHFIYDGESSIALHLARDNPIWDALDENPMAVMSVIGAYTYIPTGWNAEAGQQPEYGIPTSYYGAVQASGPCTVIDDPAELAAILRGQLAHFQPEGGYAEVTPQDRYYTSKLAVIRGIRLSIETVLAKFKFGGNKLVEHRLQIAECLAERRSPHDLEARDHLLRRLPRGEHSA